MRRVVVGLLLSVAIPASARAVAPARTVAPVGNSGVSQLLETFPTANGNQPSSTAVRSGPGSSSGALSSSTLRALDEQGSDGRIAADLAQSTAPSRTEATEANPGGEGTASSPLTSIVKALTGSSRGGLGPLLPIILLASTLGAASVALLRRRRTT